MQLGIVTYNLARTWDIATIIENCQETGFTGVELRTSHAHKVESDLNADERRQIRERFAGSGVEIVGLGSAFEYDAIDPAEVRKNIEGTKEYVRLAHDLGVGGVKVRPNKIHEEEGVPREKTFEQIGLSLRECGEFAKAYGVQIRLEIHGRITCEPSNIRRILDYADHDQVYACWNSNTNDMVDGSIDANFALLKGEIGLVHITELWNEYPWQRLFELLKENNYQGFCLAEIPESADPLRLMRYYRALWLALGASE
jgi:sugar phosphate isomerase/epimerase